MHPFSYTSIKIIHDEKIREALEHHRLCAGQETRKHGLFQAFGKLLARLNNPPARNASGVSRSLQQATCSEN
jgi:hypothetical protein